MSKTYREWSPDQPSFVPPSPQDWLPEDDLVYFLIDTVATIDLSPIFDHYERERRGQPPFHPRMMVGRTALVLLRHRHTILAADHETVPHRRRLSRHRRQRHPRLPHHQRLSQDPSGPVGGALRRGAETLRPGRVGQGGDDLP